MIGADEYCPPPFDPHDWATLCRERFAERQPRLVDQVWDDIWLGVPFSHFIWVAAVKRIDRVGSIIIPERSQAANREGWVVAVGPDARYDPLAHKHSPYAPLDLVGRRVFWGAYAGTPLAPLDPYIDPTTTHPRNIPYTNQYMHLSVGDILGESLREGGEIMATLDEVAEKPDLSVPSEPRVFYT